MCRRVLLSTAICVALFASTAQARVPPNHAAPLPPELKKEVEVRTFGWKLMLGGLAGVLVFGAIGQFVLSIRNYRRAAAEEESQREDAPSLEDAFPDADLDDRIDQPAPPSDDPCGIIADER
jgi:hypothetical protein